MILRGKTQKGKNRIRELGDEWFIIRESGFVGCAEGAWLLQPASTTDEEKSRWILKKNDPDFEIL